MKKTLFLLTKTYPFGHGEQYITNELVYLSRAFEKIIIYPNDYFSSDETHNKHLPKNVEVLNFNKYIPLKSNNSFADYFYLIKNTLIEFVETDDKNNFFKNFKWNLVNFWTQLQISKSFSTYLSKNNYDASNTVLYSYWFHKSAILLSILKDKKIITKFNARAHSVDLYHNAWGIINENLKVPSFKMFKLKQVGAVFPISMHGFEFLKKKYPAYVSKYALNYLGVNESKSFKKEHSGDLFHLVTCSGIDYNKRIHKLAEALCKIDTGIQWTHFGSGDMLPQVQEWIEKMPASVKVDMKGNQANENILTFYANNQINLFVNISIVEGLPVSIMEAMAHGIPILATAIYGTPETVQEGRNGFLLDVNFTLSDLVEKITYCVNNQELMAQMGQNSYALYREKFMAEKNYNQFTEYLLNL